MIQECGKGGGGGATISRTRGAGGARPGGRREGVALATRVRQTGSLRRRRITRTGGGGDGASVHRLSVGRCREISSRSRARFASSPESVDLGAGAGGRGCPMGSWRRAWAGRGRRHTCRGGRADAVDAGQLGDGVNAAADHFGELLVGEDGIGRNAFFFGELFAEIAEADEDLELGLGEDLAVVDTALLARCLGTRGGAWDRRGIHVGDADGPGAARAVGDELAVDGEHAMGGQEMVDLLLGGFASVEGNRDEVQPQRDLCFAERGAPTRDATAPAAGGSARRPWGLRPADLGLRPLTWRKTSSKTKAQVVVAVAGGVATAVRRPDAPGIAAPGAAADDPARARRRRVWIGDWSCAVRLMHILTPLPHVPQYIVETERVRVLPAHRMRASLGVRILLVGQSARVIPISSSKPRPLLPPYQAIVSSNGALFAPRISRSPSHVAVSVPARQAYSHSASVGRRASSSGASFPMNSLQSSQLTCSTGRSGLLNPLGFFPITACQSAWVTGVSASHLPFVQVTSCCGPSSSYRPASLSGEPIRKRPGGIHRKRWITPLMSASAQRPNLSLPAATAQGSRLPA